MLDESGSMGGDKWLNAMRGLIMGGEALNQLEIDFGVVGFSDNSRVHKELSSDYEQKREAMLSDIESSQGGGTNDSQGIETALEMFERGDPEVEKVMIVITDGQGNVDRVKALQHVAAEKGVHIIGVGIGPGNEFVKDVYMEGLVVENLFNLPVELAELVQKKIEGDGEEYY